MQAQIEALKAAIRRLPSGLVEHIERMVAEAKDLGRRYGLDEAQVELVPGDTISPATYRRRSFWTPLAASGWR